MRINIKALQDHGYEVEFDGKHEDDISFIHIRPIQHYDIGLKSLSEKLAKLDLSPRDVNSLIDDFIEDVHTKQLINVINATADQL